MNAEMKEKAEAKEKIRYCNNTHWLNIRPGVFGMSIGNFLVSKKFKANEETQGLGAISKINLLVKITSFQTVKTSLHQT